MYLKILGHNLICYKYSSSDNVWGSGIVCCNHISLPMLLIKAFVIMSGEKITTHCLIAVLFAPSWSPVVKSTKGLIFQLVKYTVLVFLVLSLFCGKSFSNKCPSGLIKKINHCQSYLTEVVNCVDLFFSSVVLLCVLLHMSFLDRLLF